MAQAVICLNRDVLGFMASVLTPDSFVLECGAGGSTRWFADRCARLVSVEHSPEWRAKVRADCAGVSCDVDIRESVGDAAGADLALVDSAWRLRDAHARQAWDALRSGGWLVLDDAQRERHAGTVAWLNQHAAPVALRWSPGDVEAAKERLALAWCKP